MELSLAASQVDPIRFPVALDLTDLMEKRDFSEGTDLCTLCRVHSWHANPPELQQAFDGYKDNMLLMEPEKCTVLLLKVAVAWPTCAE